MEINNTVIDSVTEFCKNLINYTEKDIKCLEKHASKEFLAKQEGKIEAWMAVLNLLQGMDKVLNSERKF